MYLPLTLMRSFFLISSALFYICDEQPVSRGISNMTRVSDRPGPTVQRAYHQWRSYMEEMCIRDSIKTLQQAI